MKSKCCGSTTRVSHGDEGTNCYMCDECERACDGIPDDIMSRKEVVEFCERRLSHFMRTTYLNIEECKADMLPYSSIKYHMGEG